MNHGENTESTEEHKRRKPIQASLFSLCPSVLSVCSVVTEAFE